METLYVIRLYAFKQLAKSQPCFTFVHPTPYVVPLCVWQGICRCAKSIMSLTCAVTGMGLL